VTVISPDEVATPDYPPAFVPPAHLWIPPGRRGSYGDEVVDWSASIGHPVDAEQALAIDAGASYGPGGNYLALEFAVKEGRQNGKTDRVVLPMTLADFFLFRVPVITWTSHLMDTSLATFKVVKALVEATRRCRGGSVRSSSRRANSRSSSCRGRRSSSGPGCGAGAVAGPVISGSRTRRCS
jgi:hypothetical protein